MENSYFASNLERGKNNVNILISFFFVTYVLIFLPRCFIPVLLSNNLGKDTGSAHPTILFVNKMQYPWGNSPVWHFFLLGELTSIFLILQNFISFLPLSPQQYPGRKLAAVLLFTFKREEIEAERRVRGHTGKALRVTGELQRTFARENLDSEHTTSWRGKCTSFECGKQSDLLENMQFYKWAKNMVCPKRYLELIATPLRDQWDTCQGIGSVAESPRQKTYVGKSSASVRSFNCLNIRSKLSPCWWKLLLGAWIFGVPTFSGFKIN